MSGVPTGGNMWKNIIIGVLTTVVAYLIVHFLLDKNTSKEELKKKKEDIAEAWHSVTDYTHKSVEKFKTVACYSCNEQEMKKEMIRELNNNITSLNAILKSKNLDDIMQTIINRTISKFEDLKPAYSSYFDSVTYLKSLTDEERKVVATGMQDRFFQRRTFLETRDVKDIQGFLDDLNKKYSLKLTYEEEKIGFEPDALIGKWNIECLFTLTFKKDHTMLWVEGGDEIEGTWSLSDDKMLKMKLDNGQSMEYQILQLEKEYIAIYVPEISTVVGGCPKE